MVRLRRFHAIGLCAVAGLLALPWAEAEILSNGSFEDPAATPPDHPPVFADWVNVPGAGGGVAQVYYGGDFGFMPTPIEGNQTAAWVSGYDTTRDFGYLYQQFVKPANTPLDILGYGFAYAGWGAWPQQAGGPFDCQVAMYYDAQGRTDLTGLYDTTFLTSLDADLTLLGVVNNGDSYNDGVGGGEGWIEISGQVDSGAGTTGTLFVLNRHKFGFFNGTAVDGLSVTVIPEPGTMVLGLAAAGLLLRRRGA